MIGVCVLLWSAFCFVVVWLMCGLVLCVMLCLCVVLLRVVLLCLLFLLCYVCFVFVVFGLSRSVCVVRVDLICLCAIVVC